jgi:hypothetical protein
MHIIYVRFSGCKGAKTRTESVCTVVEIACFEYCLTTQLQAQELYNLKTRDDDMYLSETGYVS